MIAIATGKIKRPRYSRVRSVARDIVFKSRPMRKAGATKNVAMRFYYAGAAL